MLFAPGFAEGFSRGCGRDTGGERGAAGEGGWCPRATAGERESEKGEGALRAARGECGARGRAEGEVTDPGAGDGPRAAGLAVFTSRRESPLPRSGLN